MIFGLFKRRDGNAEIVDRLYLALSDASRRPEFYAELGVPDTVEGRFDLLTLHAVLALRRLNALPAPAPDLAQDLVDTLFRHFDDALRELGVGDISVPKRMKTMASAFYGRGKAYEEGLIGSADLGDVLSRNLFGGKPPDMALPVVVSYVRRADAALAPCTFDDFVAGRLPFPEPIVSGVAAPAPTGVPS